MYALLRKMVAPTAHVLTAFALLSGAAHATPTLTTAATTAGFGLSEFADRFPVSAGVGPLGIAFLDGGKVMVSDYPGNVRIFATDSDGQHAGDATVVSTWGNANAVGMARLGNFIYMTQQGSGNVVRLKLDGTLDSTVVTGINAATGITANAVNGKLYVSDCCGGTGIWEIDPVANTKTQFIGGSFDGLSVSADGSTLYGEIGGSIRGYRISDKAQVFDSGFISGADGTELGAGVLAGKIFVNTNFGELWEVDLADPNGLGGKVKLVEGGSRGDFVTADPNGTLLFTQTDSIWRLTAPAGGCIGANCNNIPEPGSLALVGVALLGLSRTRRWVRSQVH